MDLGCSCDFSENLFHMLWLPVAVLMGQCEPSCLLVLVLVVGGFVGVLWLIGGAMEGLEKIKRIVRKAVQENDDHPRH